MAHRNIRNRAFVLTAVLILSLAIWFAASQHFGRETVFIGSFDISEYSSEADEFSYENISGRSRKFGEIASYEKAGECAEIIWSEMGFETDSKKPYRVYYDSEKSLWLVTGNLDRDLLGGEPYAVFSENEGEVIAAWHTR